MEVDTEMNVAPVIVLCNFLEKFLYFKTNNVKQQVRVGSIVLLVLQSKIYKNVFISSFPKSSKLAWESLNLGNPCSHLHIYYPSIPQPMTVLYFYPVVLSLRISPS